MVCMGYIIVHTPGDYNRQYLFFTYRFHGSTNLRFVPALTQASIASVTPNPVTVLAS